MSSLKMVLVIAFGVQKSVLEKAWMSKEISFFLDVKQTFYILPILLKWHLFDAYPSCTTSHKIDYKMCQLVYKNRIKRKSIFRADMVGKQTCNILYLFCVLIPEICCYK